MEAFYEPALVHLTLTVREAEYFTGYFNQNDEAREESK